MDYVDLYLIHSVNSIKGDITGAWREFELLQKDGLAKSVYLNLPNRITCTLISNQLQLTYLRSIGVSNFSVDNLKELLRSAEVKPAVNQVQVHCGLDSSC